MLKKMLSLLLVLIHFLLGDVIQSQTIDEIINNLGKTVVFLQKETQSYEMKSGEKVEVDVPSGKVEYEILEVD